MDLRIFPNSTPGQNGDGNPDLTEGLDEAHREILRLLAGDPLSLDELERRMDPSLSGEEKGLGHGQLIRLRLELEERGLIEIRFPGSCTALDGFYQGLKEARQACSRDPGLWNVLAYEVEWFRFRDYFDFLDPAAPNHHLKRFQRNLYMKQFEPYLDKELGNGSRVLDAGGGVGRFSAELLRKGYDVVLVDASERALKTALRFFGQEGFRNFTLYLGDVRDLAEFPDDSFDAVMAMELLCYCTRPEQALRELMRVVVPGGLMFFSVEGKHGSLLADSKIGMNEFETLCRGNVLCREDDVFVRYFTEEDFQKFLTSEGVSVLETQGSHYVSDGVLHRFVEEAGALGGEVEDRLMDIEQRCNRDPVLKPLARAWTAVCRNRS